MIGSCSRFVSRSESFRFLSDFGTTRSLKLRGSTMAFCRSWLRFCCVRPPRFVCSKADAPERRLVLVSPRISEKALPRSMAAPGAAQLQGTAFSVDRLQNFVRFVWLCEMEEFL
ncbi:unnamed protein product [Durusdinium trenchii]|uniref:Uncharacterized protein n=1 Tax=Durusdinium trenchii TaxID=1381693 RepID=A0ABP0HJ30_9DINO